jgi:hypothetical protein
VNNVGGRVAAVDVILLDRPTLREQIVFHLNLKMVIAPSRKEAFFAG